MEAVKEMIAKRLGRGPRPSEEPRPAEAPGSYKEMVEKPGSSELSKHARKIQGALMSAVVGCVAVGSLLNLQVLTSLDSECSVYAATESKGTLVPSLSDYDEKTLRDFVTAGSVPKWVNPSWRIPSVSIVDATGRSWFVEGKAVLGQEDDQYNVLHQTTITSMVQKLQDTHVSLLKFPVTLKFIQIEGADVLKVLKSHLVFLVIILGWVFTIPALSWKGKKIPNYEIIQMFMLPSAFASLWFFTAILTSTSAITSPPTHAELAAIPKETFAKLVSPCHISSYEATVMPVIGYVLVLQAVCLAALAPIGRMVASSI